MGGLGVKGVASIGVLQSLHDHGVPIKRMVVAGAAALVAGQYALGRRLDGLTDAFVHFFEENRRVLWGLESLSGLFNSARRRGLESFSYFLHERLFCRANMSRISVLGWDVVEPLLDRFFEETTFRDLDIPISVSTVDLKTRKLYFIEEGSLKQAMKAAIAFPGLFPPVEYGERLLVSSTLCCELPIEALARDAAPVVAVNFPSVVPRERPRSLLEIIALTTEVRSNFIKEALLQEKADHVFRLEGMGRYRWGSYRRIAAMVEQARRETDRQLEQMSEFRRRNRLTKGAHDGEGAGHRAPGFTRSFPDNTIEAFNAAVKLGADGIECDVHETADSRFVIFHDNDIEGRSISEMPLAEIQQAKLAGKYRIPTLEETLETCRGRLLLNIELKLVYSLDRFLDIVRGLMKPEELLFSSFYGTLINELADLAPEIKRGILTGFPVKDPLKLVSMVRAQVMVPRFGFVTMALVDKMQSRKLGLIVWDCNTAEEIRTALAWNVDGIITDNPDTVLQERPKEK